MTEILALLSTYPYLGGSLILLLVAAAALAAFPGQRRAMLISGLLSAPYAFASFAFVPEYWNPVRVATFVAGPEDIIFSFANGCIVWAAGTWLVRSRISTHIEFTRVMKRYLALTVLGLVVSVPIQTAGGGAMNAALAAGAVVGLIILYKRWDLWPIGLAGTVSFTAIYSVAVLAIMSACPHFLDQWQLANLSGIIWLGAPIEEFVWAAAYGGVWPVVAAYVFDARMLPSRARSSQAEPIPQA